MRLVSGDVSVPLLRLLLDIARDVPPPSTKPRRGVEADRPDVIRDAQESVVRGGFPKPVRRRLGVVAEALFGLPQRFVDSLKLANRAVQVVARAAKQFGGAVLRGGQQTDEKN
jgi:hypothetical protein